MNQLNLEKYNKLYREVVEILSNKISFFDIYPKYFIKLMRELNPELIKELSENDLSEEKYINELNKLLEVYLEELDILKDKSKVIFDYKDYPNELEFFQYIMSSHELIDLISSINKKDILSSISEIDEHLKDFKSYED